MKNNKSLLDQSIEQKLNVLSEKQKKAQAPKQHLDKIAVVFAWLIAFATIIGLIVTALNWLNK